MSTASSIGTRLASTELEESCDSFVRSTMKGGFRAVTATTELEADCDSLVRSTMNGESRTAEVAGSTGTASSVVRREALLEAIRCVSVLLVVSNSLSFSESRDIGRTSRLSVASKARVSSHSPYIEAAGWRLRFLPIAKAAIAELFAGVAKREEVAAELTGRILIPWKTN